ncbi:MAG: calcium/sodium antiporter [Lachnospiraceae bacterium]|nr:calcium/sodium antiporter [Lachnospiraceae bacterium]
MFFLYILILVAGFVALIKGADLFVEGSAALAKNFKVPGLIIGLTIVALGTSAPELAVSTSAALQGSNEIALSNVVGSNIFNLLCVLGVCAMIHPVPVDDKILKRDFPVSLLATVLVLFGTSGACIVSGRFLNLSMEENAGLVNRILGIVLLIFFISYIIYLIVDAKKHPEPEEETTTRTVGACLLLILIGLALIVGGGQVVVYSAKEIARAAGMTETLIGLTIVAVGTSLPELVTSIVAARKGETGLAVGNVVGSNIFNLMFILGISATIHPVAVNLASVYDLGILIAVSILAWLFSVSDRAIKQLEGAVMLGVYVADVVFAIVR